MPGLSVGTSPINYVPSGPVTLLNQGHSTVYVEEGNTTPTPGVSLPLDPGGTLSVEAGHSYQLISASGVNQVYALGGMSGYQAGTYETPLTAGGNTLFSGLMQDGAANITVQLKPTTRSLVFIAGGNVNIVGFLPQVNGDVSGIQWGSLLPAQMYVPQSAVKVPVYGSIDTTVDLSIMTFPRGFSMTMNIVEMPDDVVPFINAQAVTAYSPFNVTLGTGASGTLLAAPGTQKAWEIATLNIRSIAAYTGIGAAVVKGTTSGFEIASVAGVSGQAPFNSIPLNGLIVAEGLTCVTSATGSPSTIFSCTAQQITL